MPKGLHTLTIRSLPAPTDGATAFADDLPALTNLALKGGEAMVSRWLSIAPLSLTRIKLWTTEDFELVGNGGMKDFVPFLRTDKVRHLELHYGAPCELLHDTVTDLKPDYDPFHDSDLANAEHVRRLVDAARSNGIKVAGSALKCLDWEQRFDDLAERYFVEHALATNDYTILRQQYGKEGAIEAIQRQRPLLAAMLSGDSN